MMNLRISSNRTDLDVSMVHRFLSEQSTWAKAIPLATLERAIENSLCFGGFIESAQVAFARVVTDYATFANLLDVFVLPENRGQGHCKALMEAVVSHQQLQGLRRFTLATSTAHALYAKYGFTPPLRPQSLMERYDPWVYENAA
jgi:GNAT superfamily N-acetyltransferase